MITDFDKGGRAAHFKRMFGECLADDDYEGAIDCLLKYSDETHFKDFHLACGMLYLEMCFDSDDNELLSMAYREFMMHLRRFPDCRIAYRDLLATLLLRRDTYAFISTCKWIKKRGIDFDSIMSELADCGALFASADDPPVFTDLFEGEYGEIDPNFSADAAERTDKAQGADGAAETVKKSKIIAFDGGKSAVADKKDMRDGAKKILHMQRGDDTFKIVDEHGEIVESDDADTDEFDLIDDLIAIEKNTDEQDTDGDFNDFINAYLFDGESDEAEEPTYDERGKRSAVPDGEDPAVKAVKKAERAYERGDLDGAIEELCAVRAGSEQYYYALNMRALICMELDRYADAEKVLSEAMEIKPDGALGGALLCQLYEYEGKTELIPQLLKKIDVKDYVNSSHLYKSFYMALKYCDPTDAELLLERYIDEFNILDMRLAYALLLYNRGAKDEAIDELYIISRIFYDDINVRYYYLSARGGIQKFPLDTTAPQDVLASLVENVMAVMNVNDVPDEIFANDMFRYSLEFFLTLEFRNDKRLLVAMFETLRRIAREPRLSEKVRDALVSPYVEPIVKAALLGEMLCVNPEENFTATFSYVPYSADCENTLNAGYSDGCYVAYAYAAALEPLAVPELIQAADELENNPAALSVFTDERDKAYYLLRRTLGKKGSAIDDRIPYALGYKSKAIASRAYRAAATAIKEKTAKGETL